MVLMTNNNAVRKQVAITHNAKNQPVAYRWSPRQVRWFRMGLEEAKLLIATEQAILVPYIQWANGKPSHMNQTAVA